MDSSLKGETYMKHFNLLPLKKGFSKSYNEEIDPRLTNEFSTAAFRFGHSLIPDEFSKAKNVSLDPSAKESGIRVREALQKVDERIDGDPASLDHFVMGMLVQECSALDGIFSGEVCGHLFEAKEGEGGLDLVAFNIQRGRDHGLPGYNFYREACGSKSDRARDFSGFLDVMDKADVDMLKGLYESHDDVDLYVGGVLEAANGDSLLGPTFLCIVGDTFSRLKNGDRFFYDLDLDPNLGFSERQLDEVRKATLARLICDNLDSMTQLQPDAFKVPDAAANRPVDCGSLPEVSLDAFKGDAPKGKG